MWNWFQTTSGCAPQPNQTCQPNLPTNGNPTIPGVAQKIGDGLTTPNNIEYAFGVEPAASAPGLPCVRTTSSATTATSTCPSTDTTTGKVTNSIGQSFDLTFIENDANDVYFRRYSGVTMQGTYRFNPRFDIGGTYTLVARTGATSTARTVANGPITGGAYQYPEYKQASWNYPDGDLAIDQRQRARLWVNYGIPGVDGLTVSLLQALESGVPYSASTTSGVNPAPNPPYITNPGYLTPPSGTQTTYFFGPRDEFRTEGQRRTDLADQLQLQRERWRRTDAGVVRQRAGHQLVQPVPALRLWQLPCSTTAAPHRHGMSTRRSERR